MSKAYDKDWSDFSGAEREAAEKLGYTKSGWDNGKPKAKIDDLDWDDMTDEQHKWCQKLGFTKKIWDDGDGGDDDDDEDDDDGKGAGYDKDWDDMTPAEREAAKTLGHTKKTWDGDKDIPVDDLDWDDLPANQREAAKVLGYTKKIWDDDEDGDDDDKPDPSSYPLIEVAAFTEPSDCDGIRNALLRAWTSYERCEGQQYTACFTRDSVRGCSRSFDLAFGAGIQEPLATEWLELERTPPPASMLAEKLDIQQPKLIALGPECAIAAYRIDSAGGVRWNFTDESAVVDLLVKGEGGWSFVMHMCQWAMDTDDDEKGAGTFRYDWITPVRSLKSSMAFYEPLIGKPTFVDEARRRAIYKLRGGGFVLAEAGGPGCAAQARPRPNMPNGYAEISVQDPVGYIKGLKAKGVQSAGPEGEFLDCDGNVFVISPIPIGMLGRTGPVSEGSKPIDGLPYGGSPAFDTVNAWLSAWLGKDVGKCLSLLGDSGVVLDTAASQRHGLAIGSQASQLLPIVFGEYPSVGLSMRVTSVKTIPAPGGVTVVAFNRELSGPGFFEHAMCAVVVTANDTVAAAVAIQPRPRSGQVLELDYCCVPVTSVKQARAFYEGKLQLGTPYSDEGWFGWWSMGAVLGTFEADPSDDGIPVRGLANGYASLWVKSARNIEALSKANGATFPCIPAINDHPGVDSHPGYIQATVADPDGNIFLATEYTGRRDD